MLKISIKEINKINNKTLLVDTSNKKEDNKKFLMSNFQWQVNKYYFIFY